MRTLLSSARRALRRRFPLEGYRGPSNDLVEYFRRNKSNQLHKWEHYFEIYDRHFHPYRGTGPVVVEIGVYHGGSLKMWKDYFGPGARIFGIDINPDCRRFEEPGIEILIGSQEDPEFLDEVRATLPRPDILIDDGGHTMKQQILTFERLFEHVREDGVYLCEDIHTSYWEDYGGGHRRPGTFIEFSKDLVDSLQAYHSTDPDFQPDEITSAVNSLHFYDSVLVIEKRKRSKPVTRESGVRKL